MSIESASTECLAKPITHAFLYFKNDDERNKYVRSANMLKKELRGRKIKISRSTDAEERLHQKRMGYVKYCIHTKHNITLSSISLHWTSKHVWQKHAKVGLSHISSTKTLNLRSKTKWKSGNQKTRNDCEQSRDGTKTKEGR